MTHRAPDYRSIAYGHYGPDSSPDYVRFASTYARRLSGRLKLDANWTCLDLACGYGNFLAFLRHSGVRDYLGIDDAASAVRAAQREFGEDHARVGNVFDFLCANTGPYRLLSSLDFIEHLRKDEVFEFLSLAREALEPGGYLLTRTPNAGAPFRMAGPLKRHHPRSLFFDQFHRRYTGTIRPAHGRHLGGHRKTAPDPPGHALALLEGNPASLSAPPTLPRLEAGATAY